MFKDETIILFPYNAQSSTLNILSSQDIFIYLNIINIFQVECEQTQRCASEIQFQGKMMPRCRECEQQRATGF